MEISDITFKIEYIYLDYNERKKFAQVSHDYIIYSPIDRIRDFIYQRILFYRLYHSNYPTSLMIAIAENIWDKLIVNKFRWYLLNKI